MAAMLLVKVTLLLLAALAVAALLRRSSCATRHQFWSAVFPALLAVPVLSLILPEVRVPFPVRLDVATSSTDRVDHPPLSFESAAGRENQSVVSREGTGPIANQPPRSLSVSLPERVTLRGILVATWVLGAVGALMLLAGSLLRVRRLAQRATAVRDSAWIDAVREIADRLGLERLPRLLVSPAVRTPMAGGLLRPLVFLPPSSASWNAEQRAVILTHEMVHLVERDPLRHVVTRLTLACYWFHPLAWIAARQAAIVREEACDATVLSLFWQSRRASLCTAR